MRILVLHPKHWTTECKPPSGVEVRHVSVGGRIPRRQSGAPSGDGIGDVVTTSGINALTEEFERFQPDVFLFGIHMGFSRLHLKALRYKCKHAKLVMHYTDQRPAVSRFVKEHVGLIDMLLVTNADEDDHAMYHREEIPCVETFYDGVSLSDYWPCPVRQKYDCFFGGNNFWRLNMQLEAMKKNPAPWIGKFTGAKMREEFLLMVHKRFKLLVRGEWGWNGSKFTVEKPRFHPHYLGALREARIVLNTINVQRYGLLTRRLFRSIASGRMYLTEYSPGLEEFFTNHKHLVWFKTIEEGIDLLRFYLDHAPAREKIAQEGRAEIARAHTWQHRLDEFVPLIRRVFG